MILSSPISICSQDICACRVRKLHDGMQLETRKKINMAEKRLAISRATLYL